MAASRLSDLGEDGLLRLLEPLLRRHSEGLPLGTGDDVAVTPPPGPGLPRLVWTIDAMVEGTHFRFRGRAGEAQALGRKLAASNLSDLASKGAEPQYALLVLGAPGEARQTDLEAFFGGLGEELTRAGARLVGGDTVRAPQWTLSLALVGTLEAGLSIARRNRAKPGHGVYVTGDPGRAGAGLMVLESGQGTDRWPGLLEAHLRPVPRLAEGRALVAALGDLAMIDLSDGVARDARRIAQMSGVRMVLEEARLVYADDLMSFVRSRPEGEAHARQCYLHGGEDYELLFTTAASEEDVRKIFRDAGIATPVRRIGTVQQGQGLVLQTSEGVMEQLGGGGFEHFA